MRDLEKLAQTFRTALPESTFSKQYFVGDLISEKYKEMFGVSNNLKSLIEDALKPYNDIYRNSLTDAFRINTTISDAFKINNPIADVFKSSNPFADSFHFHNPLRDMMEDFKSSLGYGVAETILKQNQELSRSLSLAFSESFKQNDIFVNQMKNLTKESSLFGLGVSSSLKIFDEPIMSNIAEVLKDIQQNPEKYKEIVEEVPGKNNIYSYKVIADYLTLKIPELFTTEKILFFLLSMAVQNAIGEFIKEQIVAPNICIARSGCRIRESGTIQSEIQVVVPSGEEVLVMEDRGRWKKVFWT